MIFPAVLTFARSVLSKVPMEHWVVMVVVSLALPLFFLIRKKCSVYGAIIMGLTVFIGLLLLDAAALSRISRNEHPETVFSLPAEYHRLIHCGTVRWTEMLANVAVFVPFGFFLSEFLSTTKRFAPRRQLRIVVLSAFGLSLCIECLQLFLHLGVCELTDLVLNTLGGFVGVLISVELRKVVGERRH